MDKARDGLMGMPRSTIRTWRLLVPILLLPISKDKLIATIAVVPGFLFLENFYFIISQI
jgi:hypothetical protein